ncbi:hypothetical protein YC2023_075066 [Brassica napus]
MKNKGNIRPPLRKRKVPGFPASRVIPLGPVRQRSTSSGRALPGLDRTQYRFGVQKRHGSFRMGRESNPDGGCHNRPVLPLGLPGRLYNWEIYYYCIDFHCHTWEVAKLPLIAFATNLGNCTERSTNNGTELSIKACPLYVMHGFSSLIHQSIPLIFGQSL